MRRRSPRGVAVAACITIASLAACKKESVPSRVYSPARKCAPRTIDPEPRCTPQGPASGQEVVELGFNLDTGGDQGHIERICIGLLLETRFPSGVRCTQRVGSFDSVAQGDDVYVDDAPVCLALAGERMEIRRGAELVASVRAPAGIARLPTFTSMRCK